MSLLCCCHILGELSWETCKKLSHTGQWEEWETNQDWGNRSLSLLFKYQSPMLQNAPEPNQWMDPAAGIPGRDNITLKWVEKNTSNKYRILFRSWMRWRTRSGLEREAGCGLYWLSKISGRRFRPSGKMGCWAGNRSLCVPNVPDVTCLGGLREGYGWVGKCPELRPGVSVNGSMQHNGS